MSTLLRQWLRAQHYVVDGNLPAGRAALESLLARNPAHVEARLLLASVLLDQKHLRDAAIELLRAADAPPDNPALLTKLAHALFRVGETVASRKCLEHPSLVECRDGRCLAQASQMHQLLNDHQSALALMDRARELGIGDPDFRYYRSLQLMFNGRIAEAERELEECLRLGPTLGRASLALARMGKQSVAHNHLDYIRAQMKRMAAGSEDHAAFEFAQFKELDDLGRHDEAWAALTRANAVMFQRLGYDSLQQQRQFDALATLGTEGFVRGGNAAPTQGPQPIFILGMPRSGTTLLERILSNHSQVTTAGELADFPKQLRRAANVYGHFIVDDEVMERAAALDYEEIGKRYLAQSQWRAAGWSFYVDKLPSNFMLAGMIHKALPNARILHMRRDPMDVCFSNWKALFGDSYAYSYQLDALADHYLRYDRLMRHWHGVMP
ncbi:MAG: tetratricopeptide repeat-containing sulfotransferase family protein, partial [Rhodanobacteraceae bacterium]